MNSKRMILVADGGATKTSWCISDKEKYLKKFSTEGASPYFRKMDDIVKEWKESPLIKFSNKVDQIFFYGTGIINDENAQLIKKGLSRIFPEAKTEVQSDLLAAVHATLGNKSGIACILGTGSNSCFYDGKKIVAHVPPLGYILGDEGSGANLGQQLIGDYLKSTMPVKLIRLFQKKYSMNYSEFINRVYWQERPNQFLADFVPFLSENIQNDYCQNLVENSFDSFISRNVAQYPDFEKYPICFVGSVAFYFQNQLKKVLLKRNLIPGIILKEPLLNLLKFHLQNDNHE